MDKTITNAGLLRQASDMLLSIESPSSSSTLSATVPRTESQPSTSRQSTPVAVHETLARARNMMQSSRSGGVFRRLNTNERLRATSGPKEKKSKKSAQTKPF